MMMNYKVSTRLNQFAARSALLAGVLALTSAAVGFKVLILTGADFSGVGLLAVPAGEAHLVKWSFGLSSLGNYLLLIPLAAVLSSRSDSPAGRWHLLIGVCGMSYLLLGGVGALLLAASWPSGIITYQTAPAIDQEMLAHLIHTRQQATEAIFHGTLQNCLGGLWFAGVALLQPRLPGPLTTLTWLLTLALGLTLFGDIVKAPTATQIGLAATVLFVPLWALYMGYQIGFKPWRLPRDEAAARETQ
jgi:hypothetical protein